MSPLSHLYCSQQLYDEYIKINSLISLHEATSLLILISSSYFVNPLGIKSRLPDVHASILNCKLKFHKYKEYRQFKDLYTLCNIK